MNERFWETKTLEQMNDQEWEALCDGCGKCCLHKFIEDDEANEAAPTDELRADEQVHYTNIVCSYLNTKACQCTQYENRTVLVPDCVKLTKENLKDIINTMEEMYSYIASIVLGQFIRLIVGLMVGGL